MTGLVGNFVRNTLSLTMNNGARENGTILYGTILYGGLGSLRGYLVPAHRDMGQVDTM